MLPSSPYKGLVPYSEEDTPFFFGRETETEIIIANLQASRLTLLYGASGVGKTSVLRAGVVNQLRKMDDEAVVYFSEWQSNPLLGLRGAVVHGVRDALDSRGVHAFPTNPFDEWDQIAQTNLGDYLNHLAGLVGHLRIILDQFEEYFLYHSQEDGAFTFFDEFPRALNRLDSPVSFLISMREDALTKLDRFKGRIPNLFDNYLRIEHLNRNAALDAIIKPLEHYNQLRPNKPEIVIEPALVDAVLNQVKIGQVVIGESGRGVIKQEISRVEIETPYLQLVMARLWDEEMRLASFTLRLKTLEGLGGATQIVRTHLDTVLQKSKLYQDVAAKIFEFLVTPSGTKIAHTAQDLAEYSGIGLAQVSDTLRRLSDANIRILRPLATSAKGQTHYEIFHDALAPAMIEWGKKYRTRKKNQNRFLISGLGGLAFICIIFSSISLAQSLNKTGNAFDFAYILGGLLFSAVCLIPLGLGFTLGILWGRIR
jgi:KaiC/GvpD/RAD55 family RecA-like ATPase